MPQMDHASNPTSIKKISKGHINISLSRNPKQEPVSFSVEAIDLSDLALPPDSRISVIALHKHYELRVENGTVGSFKPIVDKELPEQDNSTVKFRVIVCEARGHKILASAENVRVKNEGEATVDPREFFAVEMADLGETLWELDTDGGSSPVLKINNRDDLPLQNFFHTADPLRLLIFTGAFQQALHCVHQSQSEEWAEDWKYWLEVNLKEEVPDSEADFDKVNMWASSVGRALAEKSKFATSLAGQPISGDNTA